MAKLDRLFMKMVESKCSDLHLTSGLKPYWRLHGEIKEIDGEEKICPINMKELLYEIIPRDLEDQFNQTHDVDFAYSLPGYGRFRANYFADLNGMNAVFRTIPDEILTADQLGLTEAIRDLCNLTKGLVLVTGPTGSGKSTTLAAMIDLINKTRNEHIITIEDPIEFVHPQQKCLIHQRQIGKHTTSFKRALKAALREDPDIVLVGEMRDLETIEIALETAETGHLVFGTLHTSTAASTVERIIQQFPGDKQDQVRQMLAGSLKGVIAQNLLKRADKPGRVAAQEILIINSAIANQIREGKTHQIESSMQIGKGEGMKLLNDSLEELIITGKVTVEEALSKSINKADLKMKVGHLGEIKKELDQNEEVKSSGYNKSAIDSALGGKHSFDSEFPKPKRKSMFL